MAIHQPKSFWKRPEGVTGVIFLIGLIAGGAYLLATFGTLLVGLLSNTLYAGLMLMALAAIVYMIADPKMRNLIGYAYKGVMRRITGLFVQIDPIGILKNYIEDLKNNLRHMSKQIGNLRGQMRRLKGTITQNSKTIEKSMRLANRAKANGKQNQMVLELRRAGRLKDSNAKLMELYKKMEMINKVLKRMYENSEIMLEDIKDQVNIKEQERKAIRASHSAMRSAMNIISGDKDKRAMFDQAMEALAEDVANKVGEMERFMDASTTFMDSIDLQQGVFEEEGMKLLEEWDKKSMQMLLGEGKEDLLNTKPTEEKFDLNQERPKPIKNPIEKPKDDNAYDSLFGD